ncbi:unnamed protein product [Cladocopium goreaui]|uniref:Peptidylprolyl isomerase n=2 Tax=Cladocopium goreaui TaxID=2562237 RepID=A0A9P1FGD9_9DINO|nr:unnamed protein product [Cladocopium goreaui]
MGDRGYDWQSSASQLSTARSSNGGLTARSGTPRDHEWRPLKDLPRSRWANSNDVPRLGSMVSPSSSSSGIYTSRSELLEPQSSTGSNREVQDLSREMEAMRHVIQHDLNEMRGTWANLKEALAVSQDGCDASKEVHWLLAPEDYAKPTRVDVAILGAMWCFNLEAKELPRTSEDETAICFNLSLLSQDAIQWRVSLSVERIARDADASRTTRDTEVLGELRGAQLNASVNTIRLACPVPKKSRLLCRAWLQLRGSCRERIVSKVEVPGMTDASLCSKRVRQRLSDMKTCKLVQICAVQEHVNGRVHSDGKVPTAKASARRPSLGSQSCKDFNKDRLKAQDMKGRSSRLASLKERRLAASLAMNEEDEAAPPLVRAPRRHSTASRMKAMPYSSSKAWHRKKVEQIFHDYDYNKLGEVSLHDLQKSFAEMLGDQEIFDDLWSIAMEPERFVIDF